MNRNDELNEFIEHLIECHREKYRKTEEYEYQQKCREKSEELLETQFINSDKELVEEILFELLSYADREASLLYRQGLKDGIWLLKDLGVLV